MDCAKIGKLIFDLRTQKGMTQKNLADLLCICDKTVSKWERGLGCPDVSLLNDLANVLEVNVEDILNGELKSNSIVGGNMKNIKYYVCMECGNLSLCTGEATVSCCGRKLEALALEKATDDEKLNVELVENEWYITSDHSMSKEDYISFVAFATGDRVQLFKQYPEWDLCVRIPCRGHGKLIWYSKKEGLKYQLI